MIEFGSDFHTISVPFLQHDNIASIPDGTSLFADGRMGLISIIRCEGWRRLWVPDYFCSEVLISLKELTGIEIVLYPDYPTKTDEQIIIETLPFKDGDALLRVNFFGRRNFRSNINIPIPVIEDHSHDLTGTWCEKSDADWCVASMRKTLPIAGGGIVWSPKGNVLKCIYPSSKECEDMMTLRWKAMDLKTDYLCGMEVYKETFRELYLNTDEWFKKADIYRIDKRSRKTIERFDLVAWKTAKQRNWNLLSNMLRDKIDILQPECEGCNMFSFVVLTNGNKQRGTVRKRLIERKVYPAILWQLPEGVSKESLNFSQRMLSIHCDGRYSENDIYELANIIIDAIS